MLEYMVDDILPGELGFTPDTKTAAFGANKLTRRQMLKLGVAGIMAAVGNAACGPISPDSTPDTPALGPVADTTTSSESVKAQILKDVVGGGPSDFSALSIDPLPNSANSAFLMERKPTNDETLQAISQMTGFDNLTTENMWDMLSLAYLPDMQNPNFAPIGSSRTAQDFENGMINMARPGGSTDQALEHCLEGQEKDNGHGPKAMAFLMAALGVGVGASMGAKVQEIGVQRIALTTSEGVKVMTNTLVITVSASETAAAAYLQRLGSSVQEVGALVRDGQVFVKGYLPQQVQEAARNALPTVYFMGKKSLEKFAESFAKGNLDQVFNPGSVEHRAAREAFKKFVRELLKHPRIQKACKNKSDEKAIEDINKYSTEQAWELDDITPQQVERPDTLGVPKVYNMFSLPQPEVGLPINLLFPTQ